MRKTRLIALVVLLGLLLAGCGGSGSGADPTSVSENDRPTRTPRTAATRKPTEKPTATAKPRATARPRATATAEVEAGELVLYESSDAGFSILYPEGWDVDESDDAVLFGQDDEEAVVQVAWRDLGEVMDQDALVEEASKGLQREFGDGYTELDQVPQSDGSTRIDFTVQEGRNDPLYQGEIFVEQRGSVLYTLLLAATEETAAGYIELFEEIIDSYRLPDDGDLPVGDEEPIEQWATSAEASSEYGELGWAAIQATGAPDTGDCSDATTAWASKLGTTEEWIELTYDVPVVPTMINIIQSFNPNQVSQVELKTPDGDYDIVYSSQPEDMSGEECPFTLAVDVTGIDYEVDTVRITIDQSALKLGWNEIDAVQLVGFGEHGSPGADEDLVLYEAEEGDYSIKYPKGWTVKEDAPNVQFLEPSDRALIQVTYSDVGAELPHEQLVELASTGLKQEFGDSYEEVDRVPQSDGSTRLDFRLAGDGADRPASVGQVFVEQRGTALYMLFIAAAEDEVAQYAEMFEEVIDSYTLPK